MTTPRGMHRSAAVAGLALVVVLAGAPLAGAETWENDELNVSWTIPDSWSWMPESAELRTKHGIVKRAQRRLDRLVGGKDADGEGAVAELAVRDMPAGRTVAEMADDPEVRGFLTKRITSADEPAKDVFDLHENVPAAVIETKGAAHSPFDPTGGERRVHGLLLVTASGDKLMLLRVYAWPSERDAEGLEADAEFMPYQNFRLLDASRTTEEEPPPPPPDEADGPDEDEGEGEDEGERKPRVITNEQLGWTITVHPGLTLLESEMESEVASDSGNVKLLSAQESDREGNGYTMLLYGSPTAPIIDGQQAQPRSLRQIMTENWWKDFQPAHPKGELYTYPWPRRTENPTFVTLPDLSEDERDHFAGGRKDTPIDPSPSDMEKRLKVVEKLKRKYIGSRRFKAIEAWRGIMEGNRPRHGRETVLRFAWRTATPPVDYIFYVSIVGEKGYEKWGEAIRQTLESLVFEDV